MKFCRRSPNALEERTKPSTRAMTMNKLLKIFISTLFNVDALDTPLGFSTIRTYEFTSTFSCGTPFPTELPASPITCCWLGA
jgi:hypothetical protein